MPHFFHSVTSCPYVCGCQSDKTEVRQPTDWCACALTEPSPISVTPNPWAERKPAMWPVPKCHPFSSSPLVSIPHLEKILRWKIRGTLMSKERALSAFLHFSPIWSDTSRYLQIFETLFNGGEGVPALVKSVVVRQLTEPGQVKVRRTFKGTVA
jgi:hypothetical protein